MSIKGVFEPFFPFSGFLKGERKKNFLIKMHKFGRF